MTLSIIYAGLTDQGRCREKNEDRWIADPLQGLFLVADGMGGEFGGGLAAEVVVEALPALLRQRMKRIKNVGSAASRRAASEALAELSNRLRNESKDQIGLDGMGSTAVLVLVRERRALIAHLGDSRAYLLREGKLKQLTRDHALVQLLLDAGEITPEEAAEHPSRGQLTRFVGMPGEPLPEVTSIELQDGDVILLCSDGLTGMVGADDLLAILSEGNDPEASCRRLIEAANKAGGKDNITGVVVAVNGESESLVSRAGPAGV